MTTGPDSLSPMRRRAIDRLLIQYLELPDREQPAWLEQTRQRLPRLGQWLVRLAKGHHTVTLLNESVRRLAGESVKHMEVNARRLEAGNRLGPWEVIAEVGEGGMGRVYRGKRSDGAFEMEVAIKQIGKRRRGLAELLQRECRLLARLDHPSVTRLVDAGLDDQAGPFLVMEWVEGTDLGDWIEREQPDVEARLQLFERIANAAAHAHQRLIVHGDIKPGNIRIRDDGTVKLMDFGVARLLESSDMDQPGPRALTPAFAAPEQRAGEDITPASDIWSLGALLDWLLSGRDPDDRPTKPADTFSNKKLAGSLELAAIVSTACAEKADDRYANVSELVADIQHHLGHQPVSVVPATRRYRAGKFVRRNPVLVTGVASTVFALIAGLAISASLYLQANQARQQATIQQAQAEARAIDLEQVARFQEAQLAEMDPNLMGATIRNGIIEMRRTVLQDIGLEEDEVLLELRSLEANLASVNFTDVALNALEVSLFEQTLNAIHTQFEDQPLLRARLLQTLATALQELGHFDPAEAPQRKAFSLREELLGIDHPDTLTSMQEMGALYWRQSRFEDAHELISRALEKRKSILGGHHPDTLESIHGMGTFLISGGDSGDAEQYLSTAIERRREVLGPRHEKTLRSIHNLAAHLLQQGEPARAEPLLLEGTEAARDSLGPHHELTLGFLNLMGSLHTLFTQYDEAIAYNSEVTEISERLYGAEHPSTLRYRSNLANVMQEAGEYERAIDQHRQILEARTRLLGEFHADIWVSAINLGAALRGIEEYDEAAQYLYQSREVANRVFGPHHVRMLISETQIAQLFLASGDIDKAEQVAARATKIAAEHVGMESLRSGIAFSVHAMALRGQQDYEAAHRQAKIGYQILEQTLGLENSLTETAKGVLESIQEVWGEGKAPKGAEPESTG